MARGTVPIFVLVMVLTACGGASPASQGGAPSLAASGTSTLPASATPTATHAPAPTTEPIGSDFAGLAFVRAGAPEGTGPGQVFVVNTDGVPRQITDYQWDEDFGGAHSVRWSPDGVRLAVGVGTPQGVRTDVMSADGSNVLRMRGGSSMEWSPDGSRLVLTDTIDVVLPGYNPGVWVLDPSSGSEIQVGTGFFPHWYDDDSVTAFRAVGGSESDPGEPTVFLFPADGSGGEVVLITEQLEVVRSSASGRRALVAETGGCGVPCMRLSLPEDDAVWTVDAAREPAWSPEGGTVAYLVGVGSHVGLYSYTQGERALNVTAYRVTWSPDGERLVLEQEHRDLQSIVIIDVATGSEFKVISGRSATWVATE